MAKPPAGFRLMSDLHLRQLERLARGSGNLRRLKKLYERAQQDLEKKLSDISGGRRLRTMTYSVHQHRAFVAQIRQAQALIAKNMAGAMALGSQQTQRDALRQFIKNIKKMEKKFAHAIVPVPIEEAAKFEGIIDRRRTSLLKMHQTSMAQYGTRLVRTMEQELAQSLIQGETAYQAIDRVMDKANVEWWQAERIVRTEQAWAYNATHASALEDAAEDFPDMMLRWTEHVSDDTGRPLDTRVGHDSVVMHGQLATPGGLFTMPTDPNVHKSLWGQSWSHPPNRPNDRATLQPWRPHWGIPGWTLVGNRKVPYRSPAKSQ